jgi:hypothetical protein
MLSIKHHGVSPVFSHADMKGRITLKVLTTILAVAVAICSSSAFATCEHGSKTVFSCFTAKGKQIEVCDDGKVIEYSYGKPRMKPEIVVKVPQDHASTSQWTGIGRYMSYAVAIPNGNTTYSVFWSVDRLTDKPLIEAGVNVEVNKRLAATVKCAGEKNIIQHIEGIDLKPTESIAYPLVLNQATCDSYTQHREDTENTR